MVEWYIGLQPNWTINTGCNGKWFKRYLNTKNWVEYEATFARSDINENWEAFLRLVDLFKKLAKQVGAQLGYEYPIELDKKMLEYHSIIREKVKKVHTNNL